MASILALLSSILWGTADFEGGRLSKKHAPLAVLGFSQVVGLVFGVVLMFISGAWHADAFGEGGYLIPGIVAGLFGYFGLFCLYAGLSTGRMGGGAVGVEETVAGDFGGDGGTGGAGDDPCQGGGFLVGDEICEGDGFGWGVFRLAEEAIDGDGGVIDFGDGDGEGLFRGHPEGVGDFEAE